MGLVDVLLEDDLSFEEFDLAIDDARSLFRTDRLRARELSGHIRERLVSHLETYASERPQTIAAGWALAARYAEAESVEALFNDQPGRAAERMDLAKKHYHARLRIQKQRKHTDAEMLGLTNRYVDRERREQYYYWLAIAELDRGEAGIKSGVVASAPPERILARLYADAASFGMLIKQPVTFEPSRPIDFDDAGTHLENATRHLEGSWMRKAKGQLKVVRSAQRALDHYSLL